MLNIDEISEEAAKEILDSRIRTVKWTSGYVRAAMIKAIEGLKEPSNAMQADFWMGYGDGMDFQKGMNAMIDRALREQGERG